MRMIPTLLLAGVAAVGIAGAALADKAPTMHQVTVNLPDGIAHIQYAGDVAPKVTVDRETLPFGAWLPTDFFQPDQAFAQLQRISAATDRQFAQLMQQAATMDSNPMAPDNGLLNVAAGKLPPGTESYSMVSTFNGKNSCTRSVEVMRPSNGKPKVVKHQSGDCGAMKGSTSATDQSTPSNSI